MATEVMKFECPKCHKLISLDGAPKFCVYCGCELKNENIKTFVMPICPPGIPKGHCDKCRKGKLKACDECGRKEKVEYRPQWGDKCLCEFCRERKAIYESLSRSW
jgi:hypothetical protein